MKPNRKWMRLFLGLVIGGCVLQRPPPLEPPPEPEVVQEGYTIEDTPIGFELFAGSVIVELPTNGTLTVHGKVLTEDDLPFLIVEPGE